MSKKEILDEFGSTVMRMVRDQTLDRFEKIQSGELKSQRAIELHDLLSGFDDLQKEKINTMISESIDSTIFNFLFIFEDNEDKKILVSGVDVCEASDGLSGELFTEDGWINKFSKNKP